MGTKVSYESEAGFARIGLDDGKANAIQAQWCSEMNEALDRAEKEPVTSVVITGREGLFSAGLDLKVLPNLGPEELRESTGAFMDTMKRIFLFPKPVIAASGGHAIAGGMMLFLAADWRIALDDDAHRYGLNEAITGIPLLGGTMGICRASIPPAHQTEIVLHGRMLSARHCFERGVVQRLVPTPEKLLERAFERAELLRDVEPRAYAINKRLLRKGVWDECEQAARSMSGELPTRNFFESMKR
ncbi:MAG: enoyl-CoA hydratase/isomerase family protein [Deltaproteobacteria bacterium]|nr:enoyl-CoA hydratase/isomerase family protein [Deltaproteobacteria bacterium]